MLRICWIFFILLTAYLCDIFIVTGVMQVFLSAVAVFYLTVQTDARLLIPFACLTGLALDVNFLGNSYFYIFLLPTAPVFTAKYWQRQGDCSNLLMQLLPVSFLALIFSVARIAGSGINIDGLNQILFILIYSVLSIVLTSTLGILFIATADELAEKFGFPQFSNILTKLRG